LKQAEQYRLRSKRVLPKLQLERGVNANVLGGVNIPQATDIKLIKYNPYPAIKAELSVGK